MPAESRGFVSVADAALLVEHWYQTQLGQLVQDESMRPFIEDLQRQIERKVSGVHDKLGIELTDLKEVAGGEIGVAMIEVPESRAAVALTVDYTDHQRQLDALLKKTDKELRRRGATQSTEAFEGTTLTIYKIPPQREGDIEREAIYFLYENQLCASDSKTQVQAMLRRLTNQAGEQADALAEVLAYQETMSRCVKESTGMAPDLRWYVDPFGYARSVRSLAKSDDKHPGKDYVKILREQGFDAIKALGGFVNLSVGGSYEMLHRTAVYAPAIPGEPDKYRLAMRMMKFPNQQKMAAHRWLPRKLASYRTFSCDMDNAFRFFGSLFDAIAGYEDAFDGVLEGLERDPYGPQVDVQRDFVAHLGDRVMLVTDYEVPITPQCERFMIIIEVRGEPQITETVEKFMDSDQNAVRTEFQGKTVWEIQEAQADMPGDFDLDSLDLLDETDSSESDDGPFGGDALASSAVCVTDGHLFIASHADFLHEVLGNSQPNEELQNAGDFREVENAMARLMPGPVSAKFFVRTDEAYRPTYDLLRQGKMPEAETLLGRVLNRVLTPEESEDEGLLREQKIDGHSLPDFEMVRRYFGPSGTLVRSDEDGWFVVGATLTKNPPQARAQSSQRAREQSTLR